MGNNSASRALAFCAALCFGIVFVVGLTHGFQVHDLNPLGLCLLSLAVAL